MRKRMRRIGKKVPGIGGSKYRLRILLAFFAVAILAIGIIDVSVFRGLFRHIKEDSEKETRAMLHNINESYENQISQFRDQAQLLYRNFNVKAFLTTGGSEDSHIGTIYESLNALAGNMTGITSVILFYEGEDLASYETSGITLPIKGEIITQVTDTTSDKEVLLCYTNEQRTKKQFVVFNTEREQLYGPGKYGVILVVSPDAIQDKTLPWNRDAENPMYIIHKSGDLLAAQNDIHKDAIAKLTEIILSEDESENSWTDTIDGSKKTISYVWNQDQEFFSMWIQENSFSQAEINRALQTILAATILGCLAITAVIWILSGFIYRPLNELFGTILDLAPSQPDKSSSANQDELSMASAALRDVNKNMLQLKGRIRIDTITRFLRQGTQSDTPLNTLFDLKGMHPDTIDVLVLQYWIEDSAKNGALEAYLAEKGPGGSKNSNIQLRTYRLSPGELCLLCVSESGSHVTSENSGHLISESIGHATSGNSSHITPKNSSYLTSEQMRSYALELLTDLKSLYHIDGCIGISRCDRLEKLPKSYQMAKLLTEYHILSKDILVMDEALLAKKKEGPVSLEEREHILEIVKGSQTGDLEKAFRSMLTRLASYQIQDAQRCLQDLVSEVLRLSQNVAGERNENSDMYLEDFLTNQVFIGQTDIADWLCQLFTEVQELLQDSRNATSMQIMDDVISYIKQNYWNNELSVEYLAERFGFSASYFSKLFNACTDKSFPDYINQMRLQNARKMLLSDPGLSISAISKKVGFNSSSYFSAAFRKYYGISPSQIRKNKK